MFKIHRIGPISLTFMLIMINRCLQTTI